MPNQSATLCPSAPADAHEARAFAVIGGTLDGPEAAYLDSALSTTPDLLEAVSPARPDEVFRFASSCAQSACSHFDADGDHCKLVAKIVAWAPVVVDKLPRCAIRRECRWWMESGRAACLRCPQVVTAHAVPSPALRRAADPRVSL